jgi:hypothetical protein
MPYDTNHKDFQAGNWWATVSGAGTPNAALPSWADDYTRHRSAFDTPSSTTYSGITDQTYHSGTNQPTDLWYGRKESIQDVNP